VRCRGVVVHDPPDFLGPVDEQGGVVVVRNLQQRGPDDGEVQTDGGDEGLGREALAGAALAQVGGEFEQPRVVLLASHRVQRQFYRLRGRRLQVLAGNGVPGVLGDGPYPLNERLLHPGQLVLQPAHQLDPAGIVGAGSR
jgi:hypothetical protein